MHCLRSFEEALPAGLLTPRRAAAAAAFACCACCMACMLEKKNGCCPGMPVGLGKEKLPPGPGTIIAGLNARAGLNEVDGKPGCCWAGGAFAAATSGCAPAVAGSPALDGWAAPPARVQNRV